MKIAQYKKLQVGDKIYHPATGEKTILRIQQTVDWDAWKANGQKGPPSAYNYTWAFETDGGNYSKIEDRDIKGIRLVK